MDTYANLAGFAGRVATAPFAVPPLVRRLRALRPTLAVCVLPGPLDLVMAEALGRIGPSALPAAVKLRSLVQSDPSVAPVARKALERLGVKEDRVGR